MAKRVTKNSLLDLFKNVFNTLFSTYTNKDEKISISKSNITIYAYGTETKVFNIHKGNGTILFLETLPKDQIVKYINLMIEEISKRCY